MRTSCRWWALVGVAVTTAGCGCTEPYVAFPERRPPDHQYRVSGATATDFYVWDCVDGRHVVIHQSFGEFGMCTDATRETSACGEQTTSEKFYAKYPRRDEPYRRWR